MLVVIGLFAALTLLLAMLGVYGVIAFIARERMREYGVRVALGASRRIIGALGIRQALVPIVAAPGGGPFNPILAFRLVAAEVFEVGARGGVAVPGTPPLPFPPRLEAAGGP